MSLRHLPEEDDDFYISKSDQKRTVDRLQALGERLAELSDKQLKQLPIDDVLLKALLDIKKIKANEALRRHKQYIGKLMRHADEAALLAAMHPLKNPALQRQLDLIQERLLQQGDTYIGEVLAKFPAADRHTLRQYVRQAQQEQSKLAAAREAALNEQAKATSQAIDAHQAMAPQSAHTASPEQAAPAQHRLWLHLRELAAINS